MKKLTLEILYYVVVLCVYFMMTYEGPPLRVVMWYTLHRTARRIAVTAGSINLYAEHRYYESLKGITTS